MVWAFSITVIAQTKIVFNNVENLFDIYDNPDKEDDEFTPKGAKHWNFYKFRNKACVLAQNIIESCGDTPPSIIGLCEIENDSCAEFIVKRTPLKSIGYKYYVSSSPDLRGINIAVLYDPMTIKPINIEEHIVPLKESSTRNLVHFCATLTTGDTLDIILCHLPSRRGGITVSDKLRAEVYRKIKNIADSINNVRIDCSLIIMGDMNDNPLSSNQCKNLHCQIPDSNINAKALYNLSSNIRIASRPSQYTSDNIEKQKYIESKIKGTYKFQGKWDMLDQFIVSGSLLEKKKLSITDFYIYCSPNMITSDIKYGGFRPHPAFFGYKYEAGSSDHLPIVIELY